MEKLRQVYKNSNGKMPTRQEREKLGQQLGLKQKQVYKWFWEIKKRPDVDSDNQGENEHNMEPKEFNMTTK